MVPENTMAAMQKQKKNKKLKMKMNEKMYVTAL